MKKIRMAIIAMFAAALLAPVTAFKKEGVSILMVTHDSKIASYSSKLLYIKDGIIDRTIEREGLSQKEYFYKIVDINSSESQELFE